MPIPDSFPPFDRFRERHAMPRAPTPQDWFREGYMQALRDLGVRYGRPTPDVPQAHLARLVEGNG